MKLSTQRRLNLMAGTENLSIQKASNVIAGTTGLSFQDAIGVIVENNGISTQDKLNIYAETENLSVQDVLNYLESFLPQQNLIANYVMQGGELVDKVGGAGQELLFPCFKGDGSSGAHNVSIPYNEFNFNITGKFSIAFDVYVREKGTFQGLIVKREITSADAADWFVNIGYGNLSFNISNGSNIYQVYFSVENNTKYSIVVTWDGTLNVSSNLKIYANNVIKRSTSITASPQTSTAGVVIGSNKTEIFSCRGNKLVLVIAVYVQDYSFYMKGNYYFVQSYIIKQC